MIEDEVEAAAAAPSLLRRDASLSVSLARSLEDACNSKLATGQLLLSRKTVEKLRAHRSSV